MRRTRGLLIVLIVGAATLGAVGVLVTRNPSPVPFLEPRGMERSFDISSTGATAVRKSVGPERDIFVLSPLGNVRNISVSPSEPEMGLAWAPDGQALAYATQRGIDVYSLRTGQCTHLPVPAGVEQCLSPSWHPGGREIAFVAGGSDIYRVGADGGAPTLVFSSPETKMNLDWSPDGKQMAYASFFGGNSEICALTLADNSVRRLTRNDVWDRNPRWSPDGSRLAFVRYAVRTPQGECENPDIWVMTSRGQAQKRITYDAVTEPGNAFASESMPAWSPDGNEIYFIDEGSPRCELFLVGATGGVPQFVRYLD